MANIVKREKQVETVAIPVQVKTEIPIESLADLVQIGQLLAQSGMFGSISPAGGFVVACTCRQSGMTFFDYQRTYHTILNRPSMRADAMLAEFRKRGGRYTIVEMSGMRAAAEFHFEGGKSMFEMTMDDAIAAGFPFKDDKKRELKSNWKNVPADMLWARMVSRAVRRLCPEIVAGIYTPEEIEDFINVDFNETHNTEPMRAMTGRAAEVAASIESVQDQDVPIAAEQGDAAEPANATVIDFPGDDDINSAEIDYTVCPVPGSKLGVKWDDMTIDMLGKIMNGSIKHESIMPGHYEAIRDAANRKGKNNA